MNILKLPSPSISLNIPKMGSHYKQSFFLLADQLEWRRRCGLNYLTMPRALDLKIMEMFKMRTYRWGNFNFAYRRHIPYSKLPPRLRKYPTFCALRDTESWSISYYSHHISPIHRLSPENRLLAQAIRLLMLNDRDINMSETGKAHLLKHREAFIDRFKNENIEGSGENVSLGSFLWFFNHIRLNMSPYGQAPISGKMGFLTFRAIGILFKHPKKVFHMSEKELGEYFASNKYRQDIDCNYFLNFNKLTDSLCSLMIDELGYNREIVLFTREALEKNLAEHRFESSADVKARAVKMLDEEGLLPEILESEWIYHKYLYPLAADSEGANRLFKQGIR